MEKQYGAEKTDMIIEEALLFEESQCLILTG